MIIHKEFNIDKVICDIDVRYYVDCSFSKDNGNTWENDFDDDETSDAYVRDQLPCMKEVTYTKRDIWSGKETRKSRKDWCPVIDVNEGKILDWPEGFCLETYFKVCDQGIYVYSNYEYAQGDWENTLDFFITRHLTTRIFVHLRYDKSQPYVDSWKYWQLKETLSFGLTYRFSTSN